jgi:hypothetical protein
MWAGSRRSQYFIRTDTSLGVPEVSNFASWKLGGPSVPVAPLDAQTPSLGMPKRPVSSFPFLFSS